MHQHHNPPRDVRNWIGCVIVHALNGWLCSMYVFRLFGGELKLKLIEFVLQRTSFDLLAGHDKIARFETQLKQRNSTALYPHHLASYLKNKMTS